MANRYVPFGYEITGGKIAVIEFECRVVENIYALYINGKSFCEIADRMNSSGISYNNDGREWNKNIIKRILENPKYIGEDEYPVIITMDTFEKAKKIREHKYVSPSKEQKAINDLYNKLLVCSKCGEKLEKYKCGNITGKAGIYRRCRNPECTSIIRSITEEKLENEVIKIMNRLIEDYDRIERVDKSDKNVSSEETEILNEIEKQASDCNIELQDVIDKIFSVAQIRFAQCKTMDCEAINEKIKKELAIHPPMDKFDVKLINEIVKSIRLHPEKVIEVELINGYSEKGEIL